ncbi:MAG: TonB-dependent receptor [Cyclobacteriaceae bacterium]|nr:TonB-dependent receptor [Cyclobacteriaceae bacterium HetDA_MAG_MS6]
MRNTLLFLFTLLVHIVAAQDLTVQGTVLDENGKGLPGATVAVQGTNRGTSTGGDGSFTLTVPANATLIVSSVGYKTQTIALQANLKINMEADLTQLQNIVVVGSRNPSRTELETPVPVDVIKLDELKTVLPQTTLNDMMTYLAPSFNSQRQSASDGTEHIDPASLRGLGPDQVLVLVNGKRRHTTSLVNYQSTVGNGSVGTDLSSIPASAIERIEVLRDGAAAQYGSDAIAGVINLVLKKDAGLSANVTYGGSSRGDGETFNANVHYGATVGSNGGSINLTAEINDRQRTNRTQNHNLVIYDQSDLGNFFAYDFSNDGARERDDDLIAAAGLTRDDFNFQIGDADIRNIQFFANLALPVGVSSEFYAAGGANFRSGTGFGFRRLPSEGHVLAIFPNGFQPELESNIIDNSLITGFKTNLGFWNFDISNTFGLNDFEYTVSNTVNDSLGANSPTSFDAGGHSFLQNTINADLTRFYPDIMSGFNIAFGAEFRIENYQINAGESGSYIGEGANSFPGFSPLNEVDESRSNISAYADLEFNITEQLLVTTAGRFENYSDFGSTINGKLAARYEFSSAFALRGAISTGFRAPSLHQQYFNNIATDIVDGELVSSGIFRNDSDIARQLGIPELEEETSVNASVGFTISAGDLRFSADAYNIDIDDRIILTGSLGNDPFGSPVADLVALFSANGASSGRFFTNAVNTNTKGLDVVVDYGIPMATGRFGISALYNYNKTEVDDDLNQLPAVFDGQEDVYFGPQEKSLIETNNPQHKGILTLSFTDNLLAFMLRNTYFGEVTRNGFPFGEEQVHDGKVVTDVSASYNITPQISLTVGANNLFDVFPDEQVYSNSYFGVFKYAPVQMGMVGAFYFGRVSFKL